MSTTRVYWRRAVAAAVVAEAVLVAASVLWVTFYSYVVNPGQPVSAYQQHATASGPWVSIVAGAVVFFAMGRWWIRSLVTAVAWVGVYLAADASILWAVSAGSSDLPWGLVALSYVTKILCGLLGASRAERAQAPTRA